MLSELNYFSSSLLNLRNWNAPQRTTSKFWIYSIKSKVKYIKLPIRHDTKNNWKTFKWNTIYTPHKLNKWRAINEKINILLSARKSCFSWFKCNLSAEFSFTTNMSLQIWHGGYDLSINQVARIMKKTFAAVHISSRVKWHSLKVFIIFLNWVHSRGNRFIYLICKLSIKTAWLQDVYYLYSPDTKNNGTM